VTSAEWFGVGTGVVGAVTGIAGAIMGYVAYRRSEELKRLDLRIELRRAESDLRLLVQELPRLVDEARGSRIAVTSARGVVKSGWVERFTANCQGDIDLARSWERELPPESRDYLDSDHGALERRLIEVHRETARASSLRDRYRAELAKDDKDREHIRAAALAERERWDKGGRQG
jgi:hypothetical protein